MLFAISLTGCSFYNQSTQEEAIPKQTQGGASLPEVTLSPSPETVQTSPRSAPIDQTPESSLVECFSFDDALLLVNNWADVLENRGTQDHFYDFLIFKATVEGFTIITERSENECRGVDELEHMIVPLSGLEIMIEQLGVPDDRFYNAFTLAGNDWLEAIDVRGLIFKTP